VVVERDNLKEQIARALRLEILTGRMGPGTTYKMGSLAERYGASRTPIREAVLELAAMGLVEITRGVGFRVIDMSPKEWSDSLAVREMLEMPAMMSIVGKLGPAQLSEARRILERLGDCADDNDLVGFLAADEEFHLYLVAQAGNAKLTEIVRQLRDAQRVPGLTKLASQGNLGSRQRDHVDILYAIEAGDAERVGHLVRNHLSLSRLSKE